MGEHIQILSVIAYPPQHHSTSICARQAKDDFHPHALLDRRTANSTEPQSRKKALNRNYRRVTELFDYHRGRTGRVWTTVPLASSRRETGAWGSPPQDSVLVLLLRHHWLSQGYIVSCYACGRLADIDMRTQAVMISHYTVMCSILQVAGGWHANENYAPPEEQRLKAGDVISGGEYFLVVKIV